jgi:integrative and conjugative element protein (TIGR02256 family)
VNAARGDSRSVYVTESAERSHPIETGGILLGVQIGGRPCVTRVVEIASDDRSETHYRLPGGQTKKHVRDARKQDRRVGYLGEWHSHPADRGPSSGDRATMRGLSYFLSLPLPLLIVVRRGPVGGYLDVRQAIFPMLVTREVRLVGDVPGPLN